MKYFFKTQIEFDNGLISIITKNFFENCLQDLPDRSLQGILENNRFENSILEDIRDKKIYV